MWRNSPSPSSCSKRAHPISPLFYTYLQVSRIKEKVEEQSGVPPPQQRLIYAGRQMYVLYPYETFDPFILLIMRCRADDKVVKEFNIAAGAVLHLVLALRGGAC